MFLVCWIVAVALACIKSIIMMTKMIMLKITSWNSLQNGRGMLINIHNKVNCSAILLSAYSYISKIQRNLNTLPVTSSRGHVLRLQRGDRSFLPVTIDNQAPSDIMVSKIDHIFCLLLYLLFYFILFCDTWACNGTEPATFWSFVRRQPSS